MTVLRNGKMPQKDRKDVPSYFLKFTKITGEKNRMVIFVSVSRFYFMVVQMKTIYRFQFVLILSNLKP